MFLPECMRGVRVDLGAAMNAISADFAADHRAHVRAVGIPNTAGTHALVSPSLYRSCLAEREWLYAKAYGTGGPSR